MKVTHLRCGKTIREIDTQKDKTHTSINKAKKFVRLELPARSVSVVDKFPAVQS